MFIPEGHAGKAAVTWGTWAGTGGVWGPQCRIHVCTGAEAPQVLPLQASDTRRVPGQQRQAAPELCTLAGLWSLPGPLPSWGACRHRDVTWA